MKGISPILASVMLIGISFMLAGIVYIWAKGFTEQQLKSASSSLECENAKLEKIDFAYDKKTKSGYVTLKNSGIALTGIKILAFNKSYSSGIKIKELNELIKEEEIKVVTFDLSNIGNPISLLIEGINCRNARLFISLK